MTRASHLSFVLLGAKAMGHFQGRTGVDQAEVDTRRLRLISAPDQIRTDSESGYPWPQRKE